MAFHRAEYLKGSASMLRSAVVGIRRAVRAKYTVFKDGSAFQVSGFVVLSASEVFELRAGFIALLWFCSQCKIDA